MAYRAALDYIISGRELIEEDAWQTDYALMFNLHKEHAELAYLNGRFEQSDRLIRLTLSKSPSLLEQAELHTLLIIQYTMNAKYVEAIQAGRKALGLLDIAKSNILLPVDIKSFISVGVVSVPSRKYATLVSLNFLFSDLANVLAKTSLTDDIYFSYNYIVGVSGI